jgi:hypothetical protein
MEKETRKKSIQRLKIEGARRVLNILEGETPLTAIEVDAVIDCISDDHIALLAKGRPKEIKGRCISGFYVGEGTCLAKKFGKYGAGEDPACRSCKHGEILDQLNYIFREVFGGKYRAEWRQKRDYKKRESKDK